MKATPWSQFVVGNVMELVAANRAAQLSWGTDLELEPSARSRPQLHSLALLAEPKFAPHVVNFDECLATVVGILKAVPSGGAALDAPDPWVDAVLAQVAANHPSVSARLIRSWETSPPFRVKSHNTYRVAWREPEGETRFLGATGTASEPDGLAFNDWIPADAQSHAVLERGLAGRAGQPAAGRQGPSMTSVPRRAAGRARSAATLP